MNMITCHHHYSSNPDVLARQIMKKTPSLPPSKKGEAQRLHPLTWTPEEQNEHLEPEKIFRAGLHNHHLANTAYPIAHRKTIWAYRQSTARHSKLLAQAFEASDRMGLYVQIPFCERRCAFCEYTVMDCHDEKQEATYHQALLKELERYMDVLDTRRKELAGFDIGGGTPSLIQPYRIGELVERVVQGFRLSPGFGMSIETTPKIAALHPERLVAYKSFDIERISMGLQMVNPRLLKTYERDINKIGYNHQAVENIRKAGFQRFNIDLMYGFAKQTPEDFRRTLEYTIQLNPEYITLYRMRYKGTRIAGEAREIELKRVIDMYMMAREFLIASGYQANPGKNGFSRVPNDPGTSEYLTERVVWGTPYLGLGLGAQTFTNNLLAYNHGAATKRMDRYLQSVNAGNLPIQDLYHLPLSDAMAKMISVSFYFGQIHLTAFRERFGKELGTCFPDEIAYLLEYELMEYHDSTIRLTPKGAKVINGVIALFYSNRVKKHLLSL